MPTVYGATKRSTWRSYLTYTVTENVSSVVITITDMGIEIINPLVYWVYSISGQESYTAKINTSNVYNSNNTGQYAFSSYDETERISSSKTLTIQKTAAVQQIPVEFSIYFKQWTANNMKSFTEDTSIASATVTVAALSKPTLSLTAERDLTDPSKVTFISTVTSYVGDAISNFKLKYGSTTVNLTGGTIGAGGSIVRTTTVTGLTGGQIPCTLDAKGNGGDAAQYAYNVPLAFFTLDIGGAGKSIAFGGQATDSPGANGRMDVFMDLFINSLKLEGFMTERGTTSGGWKWKKFDDGRVEANLRAVHAISGTNTSFASGLYYKDLTFDVSDLLDAFPDKTLSNFEVLFSSNGNTGNGYISIWRVSLNSTNKQLSIRFISNSSANMGSVTATYQINFNAL